MVKCHAHTQVGTPCGHYPMHGQKVCHVHGGKSPQALAKAKDRLLALEHPAITALGVLIASGDFQAVRWLLEVLGHKATLQVQSDTEVTVRIVHEDQPIVVLERGYKLGDGNGTAR